MSTALVLGNGSLLINIDEELQVKDFYFPHVGQENHLTSFINKVIFRINGQLSLLNRNEWDIDYNYEVDSLVGKSRIYNRIHNIEIFFYDFVIPNDNIFFRYFIVNNKSQKPTEVSVYFQNNFSLYETDIGDTCVWYQPASCLVHYKKNRYIGVGSTKKLYQFTCAARTDNENRGAYPDLTTGELHFNPISNGSVNSCISYKFNLEPGTSIESDYFNLAGNNFEEITKLVTVAKSQTVKNSLDTTIKYWQNWIRSKTCSITGNGHTSKCFSVFTDDNYREKIKTLYKKSLLILRSQIDNHGAIIAANDGQYLKTGGKDTYSYFWPRDGAYIALTLIENGFYDLLQRYFTYINEIIHPDGYFLHKYFPKSEDKHSSLASSWHPWVDKFGHQQLPIQEDETALNLYAIWKYYEKFSNHELINKYWDSLIFPMMNFLGNYRYTLDYESESCTDSVEGFDFKDHNECDKQLAGTKLPRPSYDLWEVRKGILTYTSTTVYAGMIAGAKLSYAMGKEMQGKIMEQYAQEVKDAILKHLFDEETGLFIRRLYVNPYENQLKKDKTIDASLYAVWHFGLLDINDQRVINTMNAIEQRLSVKSNIGGIARHEGDWYHKVDDNVTGNPWFICTLWMAQYHIMRGDIEQAKYYIKWVVDHADHSGLMAEQSHPYSGVSVSVKPLTWSHSEFVRTLNMIMLVTDLNL